MKEFIEHMEEEIARLEQSPSRECIEHEIADLKARLERFKARYPVNPETQPEDAAATL
jgi:hypothetical protein